MKRGDGTGSKFQTLVINIRDRRSKQTRHYQVYQLQILLAILPNKLTTSLKPAFQTSCKDPEA